MANRYGYITGTIRWNSKVQRRRMQMAAKKSERSLNGFMLVACERLADEILGKPTKPKEEFTDEDSGLRPIETINAEEMYDAMHAGEEDS